jgi:hypothetical protein
VADPIGVGMQAVVDEVMLEFIAPDGFYPSSVKVCADPIYIGTIEDDGMGCGECIYCLTFHRIAMASCSG